VVLGDFTVPTTPYPGNTGFYPTPNRVSEVPFKGKDPGDGEGWVLGESQKFSPEKFF